MKIITVIALAIFAVGCSNPVLELKTVTAVELAEVDSTVFSRSVELQRTIIYDDGSVDTSTEIFTADNIGPNTFSTEVDGIVSNDVSVNFDYLNFVGTFISRVFNGVQYFIEFYNDGTSKRGYIDVAGTHYYAPIYNWTTQADSNDDGLYEFAFYVSDEIRGYVNYTFEANDTEDCLSIWFNGAPADGYKYYRSH